MTNELAIKILAGDVLGTPEQTQEAVIMAVKALSQPDDSDTISRQAAIDEIKALYEWHDTVTEDMAVDHLNRLPSAGPRPRGRWRPNFIYHYEDRFVCSVCGRSYKVDTCMGKPIWDFCPNCGADMRGEEQDGQN